MRIRRKKSLIEQAADYVEAAVDKAGPILADAKDKAGAAIAEARDQAGPALVDARDKAAPLIAQSAALAAEKASQAADATSTKAADLTGKPKKKHRLRKLVIFGGLAALLGVVVRKMRASADAENWQSSYSPTPAPRDADRTDTPIADAAAASAESAHQASEGADEGGAGPDEALSDAADETHEVTTPDEPADVVDVSPGEEPVAKRSAKP
jgi:ElaB/YqjD/DUF883 family membrane-anchored ribosome-binding protein